jgi:alpha-L-arabinofuranosidase
MVRFAFILVIMTLFTTLFSQGASAQITVSIQRKRIAEIKPYSIGGVNFNNAMNVIPVLKEVKALKIPAISFPAGNVGDEKEYTLEAIDFFKIQQKLLDRPLTFFQINLFSGTPDYAVKMMARAKEKGVRVDVWVIGNEPDHYIPIRKDPSWTKEKYCKKFREFARAMRRFDPNAKLAGPVVTVERDTWISCFIKECGDLMDVLVWHWYPTDGNLPNDKALSTASYVRNEIKKYKEMLKSPISNPRGFKRNIETAINEYAIHWDSQRTAQIGDIVGAMWLTEVLGIFVEQGLDYSHFFCLLQYGGHSLFDIDLPRPSYYVFEMYRKYFGKYLLSYSQNDPLLKIVPSETEEGVISVFLVNEDAQFYKRVTLVIDELKILNKGNIETFLIQDDYAGKVKPGKIGKIKDNHITLDLPPYSILCLRINEK